MRFLLLSLTILIFSSISSQNQEEDDRLIQFSGITLVNGRDTLEPVPFVLVKNKSRLSGAYSGIDGFFSLVVKRGDTVEFTSVGYKKSTLIIPSNIQKDKFYASQPMVRDTQRLNNIVIVPWKNINELKRAFIDLKLTEDDLVIAYQNLQYEKLEKLRETLPIDGDESKRYNNSNQNLLLLQGTIAPSNLLTPYYNRKRKTNIDTKHKYEED